ncbi:MAG: potassium channel protein [Firmicutes bacterium]|nr:potassium channel protein [Bacillota bacterium]
MAPPPIEGYTRARLANFYFLVKVILTITVTEIFFFSLSVFLLAKFEHLPAFKAFYLAVITVFTVGYGDIYPVTRAGMLTIFFLLFTGVGYISTLSSMITTLLIEGHIISIWRDKSMQKRISRLRNHVIICGLGRAGSSAMAQLRKDGIPFVGIDNNEHHYKQLEEDGELVLFGDATEDSMLEKAGIAHASSLISALPDDAGNILITMAAKDLNKNIRVVARSNRKENEKRLVRAGADWVITLGFTGGARMAMAAVKPATVDFLQNLLDWDTHSLKLEEFVIEKDCTLVNKEIGETGIKENFGVQVLALIRNGSTFANPSAREQLLPGDIIITFGTVEGLNEFGKQLGISCPLKPAKTV